MEEVEEEGNPQPIGESGARVMDPDVPCTEVVLLPSLEFANDNVILPYDSLNANGILQINDNKKSTWLSSNGPAYTLIWARSQERLQQQMAQPWFTASTGICGNITRSDWAHLRNLI